MSDQEQSSQPSGQVEARQAKEARPERQERGGESSRGVVTSSAAGEQRGGGGGGRRRHRPSSPQQQQSSSRRADVSLNMEELRELMDMFTAHGLTDFEIENEDIRVRLSRNPAPHHHHEASSSSAAQPQQTHATPQTHQQTATGATGGAQQPNPAATSATPGGTASPATHAAEEKAEDLHTITSPIVGTFYRSPSPTADVFVRVGSRIEADTTVCIIEAMKLMNEIQAETSGTVEKIYVENGQPVEYGQPLFGIRK